MWSELLLLLQERVYEWENTWEDEADRHIVAVTHTHTQQLTHLSSDIICFSVPGITAAAEARAWGKGLNRMQSRTTARLVLSPCCPHPA